MEIGGIPIHLVDTAGMRSDGDHVEQLGVERSIKAMEQADLVLAVFDLSTPWDEADTRLLESLDPVRSIIVANKSDLVRDNGSDLVSAHFGAWTGRPGGLRMRPAGLPGARCPPKGMTDATLPAIQVRGFGSDRRRLDDLRALIQRIITGGEGLHLEEPLLATERQRVLVSRSAG